MDLRERLHKFIHHPVVDASLVVLILISVGLLLWELTIKDPALHLLVVEINDALTAVFIVELGVRFYVARSKKRFFRQYWMDIIAVIPWMRSLRILRLLRLLRIFRVGMLLNRRLQAFSSVFRGASSEYLIMAVLIVLMVLAGAIGIRIVEGEQNMDFHHLDQALWWSVMTLVAGEPIGGEAQTMAGRLVSLGVMLGGLTLFAMFTGLVSAVMVNRMRNIKVKVMDLDELRGHIIICGWNRSGRTILKELSGARALIERGIVIVAEFDKDPDLGDHGIDPDLIFIVRGDFTQITVLKECGGQHAGTALLLADDTRERGGQDIDARTVLASIAIERMNPEIFSSVELLNRENGAHLRVMGVEEIVVGDEYAGTLIAMGLRNRGIARIINDLMSVEGNGLFKIPVPPRMVGRSVGEVAGHLRERHRVILVAIESREGESRKALINPPSAQTFKDDDFIVVIADGSPNLADF